MAGKPRNSARRKSKAPITNHADDNTTKLDSSSPPNDGETSSPEKVPAETPKKAVLSKRSSGNKSPGGKKGSNSPGRQPLKERKSTVGVVSKVSPAKKEEGCSVPPRVEREGPVKVVIPTALLGETVSATYAPGECSVLVQIGPDDADVALDFHGASGAVGRFEAHENGST